MWTAFGRWPDISAQGNCLAWVPDLIWPNVASDAVIAAVSLAIAAMLMTSTQRNLGGTRAIRALALLAAACGLAHGLSIVTIWVPVYAVTALVKALAAVASIGAAIVVWPLLSRGPPRLQAAGPAPAPDPPSWREADDMRRQTEKMDAIGQLTGGVAHDFNNLLTIISGNLEIADRILRSWSDGTRERLMRALANAASGAQRAAMLTQRLLAFARLQPLDPRVTDLNDLISGMADFFQRSLGRKIELEFVRGTPLWRVEVDLGQMEAAIHNLVLNARDAMAGHGRLTIETRNAHLDQSYSQQNAGIAVGDYVQISVSDTGGGMSRDVQAKAFDPFFTTKQSGQGTGLGLSQVYGFVRQSGGHVTIHSELGVGTRVQLYLPRAHAAASAVDEVDAPSIGAGGGESILVVEDEAEVRSYLVETLTDLNYRVQTAPDGAAALAMYDTRPFRIDLLLTDVVMPGMNGRQLAGEMENRVPGLKVLFISGYAGDAVGRQGRLDPGVSLLQKPLTQDMLATRIRELLDRS